MPTTYIRNNAEKKNNKKALHGRKRLSGHRCHNWILQSCKPKPAGPPLSTLCSRYVPTEKKKKAKKKKHQSQQNSWYSGFLWL